MRKLKSVFAAVALFAAVFVAGTQSVSAGSPLRFGVKAGVAINELKFNEMHSQAQTVQDSPVVSCSSLLLRL